MCCRRREYADCTIAHTHTHFLHAISQTCQLQLLNKHAVHNPHHVEGHNHHHIQFLEAQVLRCVNCNSFLIVLRTEHMCTILSLYSYDESKFVQDAIISDSVFFLFHMPGQRTPNPGWWKGKLNDGNRMNSGVSTGIKCLKEDVDLLLLILLLLLQVSS